jgi:hypothetical protein
MIFRKYKCTQPVLTSLLAMVCASYASASPMLENCQTKEFISAVIVSAPSGGNQYIATRAETAAVGSDSEVCLHDQNEVIRVSKVASDYARDLTVYRLENGVRIAETKFSTASIGSATSNIVVTGAKGLKRSARLSLQGTRGVTGLGEQAFELQLNNSSATNEAASADLVVTADGVLGLISSSAVVIEAGEPAKASLWSEIDEGSHAVVVPTLVRWTSEKLAKAISEMLTNNHDNINLATHSSDHYVWNGIMLSKSSDCVDDECLFSASMVEDSKNPQDLSRKSLQEAMTRSSEIVVNEALCPSGMVSLSHPIVALRLAKDGCVLNFKGRQELDASFRRDQFILRAEKETQRFERNKVSLAQLWDGLTEARRGEVLSVLNRTGLKALLEICETHCKDRRGADVALSAFYRQADVDVKWFAAQTPQQRILSWIEASRSLRNSIFNGLDEQEHASLLREVAGYDAMFPQFAQDLLTEYLGWSAGRAGISKYRLQKFSVIADLPFAPGEKSKVTALVPQSSAVIRVTMPKACARSGFAFSISREDLVNPPQMYGDYLWAEETSQHTIFYLQSGIDAKAKYSMLLTQRADGSASCRVKVENYSVVTSVASEQSINRLIKDINQVPSVQSPLRSASRALCDSASESEVCAVVGQLRKTMQSEFDSHLFRLR